MNKQFRGGIIYLVIVLVIMYFIMSITSFGKNSSSYGYSDFLNDFQSGNVTKVEISQNAEVPTGTVKVTFTGEGNLDCSRTSVLTHCGCHDYGYTHNKQAGSGRWRSCQFQDDEFWKEPGKDDRS